MIILSIKGKVNKVLILLRLYIFYFLWRQWLNRQIRYNRQSRYGTSRDMAQAAKRNKKLLSLCR